MFRSIKAQLGAVFLSFLLLVGGSVAATFVAIRAQVSDATVINLAGRQRMLTQKMIWLALAQPDSPELDAAIQLFDRTLLALRDGGPTLDPGGRVVTLSPAPDMAVRAQLDEVAQTWSTFRAHLQPVDAVALQTESPLILAQLDSAVSVFETRAQAKVTRLQFIQLFFFVAALLLLAWSYLLTWQRIISPLALLGVTARRMASGQLADPVPLTDGGELGELGQALETMRAEIAIARDQLELRVAQRTSELASAFELSQEIVAQLDLGRLLQSVADRVSSLMHARAVSLCLLSTDGEYLELVASNDEAVGRAGLRQSVQRGLARRVVGAGETTVVEAVCSGCSFLSTHAPGQCVAAPLRVGEHTLGALCAIHPNDIPFDEDETRALTLLANSAAIAIANARLAEMERRQAEQTAILAERERLAAELHDHLAQTLGFLNLKADRVREVFTIGHAAVAEGELNLMKSAIATAYGQVRAALVNLREPLRHGEKPLTSTGPALSQNLDTCIADFRETSGLPIELIMADSAALALPPITQSQVAHIVREALTNVRRHASARHVWVRVERVNGEACFTVEDDGCGFDQGAVETDQHLGLAIMRARAERNGGRLAVNSVCGAGTKVVAIFPLARQTANSPHSEVIL
ncbi:MAG: type IV pili methyl-accepting chemotaxis transducer N-terminal domain-containing protein [Chloroflexi bacterium]|nr:type IV pili methyl-accepting chemotaxis transducer N-terminal domain-containing protein [Chloroflexota bacterium]